MNLNVCGINWNIWDMCREPACTKSLRPFLSRKSSVYLSSLIDLGLCSQNSKFAKNAPAAVKQLQNGGT